MCLAVSSQVTLGSPSCLGAGAGLSLDAAIVPPFARIASSINLARASPHCQWTDDRSLRGRRSPSRRQAPPLLEHRHAIVVERESLAGLDRYTQAIFHRRDRAVPRPAERAGK